MAGSGFFLPPVVIRIVGDNRDLISKIAQTKAILADLQRWDPTVNLHLNTDDMTDGLLRAQTELLAFARQVRSARLGADAEPFWADIAKLKAELDAMSVDMRVDADVAPALAKIEALKAALASAQTGSILKAAGAGAAAGAAGSAAGATLGAGLAGLPKSLGAAGGGIGGLLGGIFGDLGWGSGNGVFGLGRGMAGFGTPLGMMGFGAEHLVASGVGVAGSMAGGLLGGGLLGLGALGTGAVGMGTDMAGTGQAIGDIRAVLKAQNQLSQATAVYGAKSAQAAAAQGQLRYALNAFNPVAKKAVLNTADLVQQFGSLFDKATGLAEKFGAQLIGSLVKTGEAFLPTIGKFAAANTQIIQKGIAGLEKWATKTSTMKFNLPGLGAKTLGTGGLSIFQNLEKVFQGELPAGLQALTQGLELFTKVVEVAGQYTGGFVTKLAAFLTKANQPASFSKWATEIGKLINLFKTWLHLGGTIIGVIAEIFKPAVGFGAALATKLTTILGLFKQWLAMPKTQNVLHSLFSAHLTEMIHGIGGAIQRLLPFLEGAITEFAKLATVGARLASGILRKLNEALNEIGSKNLNSLGKLAVGIFVGVKAFRSLQAVGTRVASTFKKVHTALSDAAKATKEIKTGFQAIRDGTTDLKTAVSGVKSLKAAVTGVSAAMNAMKAVGSFLTANPIILIAAAVALLIVGIVELAKHWTTVWATVKRVSSDAWHFLDHTWHSVESTAQKIWNTIANFIHEVWQKIGHYVKLGVQIVLAALFPLPMALVELGLHWKEVWAVIKRVGDDVWHFLEHVWTAITSDVKRAWNAIVAFLKSIIQSIVALVKQRFDVMVSELRTVWNDIRTTAVSVWNDIVAFFRGIPGKILAVLKVLGTDLENLAKQAWHLFLSGAESAWQAVASFFRSLPGKILSYVANFGHLLWNAGRHLIDGLVSGITSSVGSIGKGIADVGKSVVGFFGHALGIHSPSTVVAEQIGEPIMLGLGAGIQSANGKVTSQILKILKVLIARMEDFIKSTIPQFQAIGLQLMEGIAAGIQQGSSLVVSAAADAVAQALAAAKSSAGISSPSRVAAAEIGLPLAQGVALGIRQGSTLMASAMQEGVMGATRPMARGAYGGGGAVTITANYAITLGSAKDLDSLKVALEQHDRELLQLIRQGLK